MADNREDEMREAIQYYFQRGFNYETILSFLEKYHSIELSRRTLFNRLKSYGLSRRGCNVEENQIRQYIIEELDGPGRLSGYRAMWRRLKVKHGLNIPRSLVARLLKEIDPEGSLNRQARRLRRRNYLNPGPNYCWHADGYDKLKPYGFPIHGCIDGFSRRILWLALEKSNNDPKVIGRLFLNTVKRAEGCPVLVRTDRGTENGLMATTQCFLRRYGDDSLSGLKAHRYGSSHSNQRIEGWWAFLRKSWSEWWMGFFKDLVDGGSLDTSNKLQMECLWFCFSGIIQAELDEVRESWNSHYIRASRYHTAHGIPDVIYFLPESSSSNDHKQAFDVNDLPEVENELTSFEWDGSEDESYEDATVYQDYFSMILDLLSLQRPNNWRDALALYCRIISLEG